MSMFSPEIVLAGHMSSEEARDKWEKAVESGARQGKVTGKSLFLHSYENTSKLLKKCVLHYYQCYGNDFCDAMFTGEIYDYEDGNCQIHGKVTVPPAMKRFSVILFVLAIPLASLLNEVLYRMRQFSNLVINTRNIEYFTFFGGVLAIVAIGIMCRMVDKRKVKHIIEYLNEFLKKDLNGKGESRT